MDEEEYKGIWLIIIIIFCLILALVALVYKEMPGIISSLTSTMEEIRINVLLNKFG